MSISSPATDVLQALNVLLELSSQGTFNHVVGVDLRCDRSDLDVSELTRTTGHVDFGPLQDQGRGLRTNTIDVLQRIENLLVVWNVYAGDTRHDYALRC